MKWVDPDDLLKNKFDFVHALMDKKLIDNRASKNG